MKKLQGNRQGFTLIELMLVVIIIATLAALVLPKFSGQSEAAKVAATNSQINSLFSTALGMYEVQNGNYPTTEQGLEALRIRPSTPPEPINWKGPYLEKDVPLDPWGKPYKYVCPGIHNPDGYDLSSFGPDGQEGTADDIVSW